MLSRNIDTSVVIVSSRRDQLSSCINLLLSQTMIPNEIIVVWNGYEDVSIISNQFKKNLLVRFIINNASNVSHARNVGWKSSKSQLIAYTDDDCIVSKHWLFELVHSLEKSQAVAAGSIREASNEEKPLAKIWQDTYITFGKLEQKYEHLKRNPYVCTSSSIFRKSALRLVGGFDENLTSGEDYDISKRLIHLGGQLIFVPQAKLKHKHPASLLTLFKQQKWYGQGRFFIDLKCKENTWKVFLEILFLESSIFLIKGSKFYLNQKNLKLAFLFVAFTVSKYLGLSIGYFISMKSTFLKVRYK